MGKVLCLTCHGALLGWALSPHPGTGAHDEGKGGTPSPQPSNCVCARVEILVTEEAENEYLGWETGAPNTNGHCIFILTF